MDTKIKLRVQGLTNSQIQSGAYALILAEENGARRVPIIVGTSEAQSIAIALEHITPPRPLTHDLFMTFAQAFGIHLSMMDYITVIGTATLASIGTAGIPSVGLVTLTMVFNSVGLPVEAIGLIMGIDRILDMLRTAVNITGDAVCTTIVSHQEKALNREVFNRN